MKGWTITIVTGLIALYASGIGDTENSFIIIIGFFPTLAFWLLDSYYLTKERDFITIFNIVSGVVESELEIKPLEIMPKLGEQKARFFRAMFSPSEIGLYLSIIILIAVIVLVI